MPNCFSRRSGPPCPFHSTYKVLALDVSERCGRPHRPQTDLNTRDAATHLDPPWGCTARLLASPCLGRRAESLEPQMDAQECERVYRRAREGAIPGSPRPSRSRDHHRAAPGYQWLELIHLPLVHSHAMCLRYSRCGSCGVDFTQRWVVNDNWTYTADLAPLTKKLGRDTRALLVFFGIDTIANIVSVVRASRQYMVY